MLDVITYGGEHFFDYVVATFAHHQFDDRIAGFVASGGNLFGNSRAAGQVYTAAQRVQRFRRQSSFYARDVGFAYAIARVGQDVGQIAVVGHDQQAVSVFVEAAHREYPLAYASHQVEHGFAAKRIVGGTHATCGLVEQIVDEFLARQGLAVDCNGRDLRVDLQAHLDDCFAVDADSAFGDDLFAFAAGGDPGAGENFLQSLKHSMFP